MLKQLKNAESPNLFVRIIWPTRAADTICRLADLRDNTDEIAGGTPYPPKAFEVFLLVDDGRRFPGRKTFIEDLERAVPQFYDTVGQKLERWVAKPPKPVAQVGKEEERGTHQESAEKREMEIAKFSSQLNAGNQHSALLEVPRFLRPAGVSAAIIAASANGTAEDMESTNPAEESA